MLVQGMSRADKMRKKLKTFQLLIVILVATISVAAQERGQYPIGERGLNPAEQPGEGLTYANIFYWYNTSKFKGPDGEKVPIDFSLDVYADFNVLAYTPKKKFLGATYSASVTVPIQNTPVSIPVIGANLGGTAMGDIYVEPISLGWALKKGKVRAAYGFLAPTGRYNAGATDNTTTDYFGHWLSLGGTYHPDKQKLWQISGSSVWEIHQTKRHEDLKVGNNVSFEYGVGRTFIKNKGKQALQLGVVGYTEFQLVNDSGTAVTPINRGNKDRVNALGGEFGLILPPKKFNLFVRVLPEYGARSRTQGFTVVFGGSKTF